ncbi:MAG TPA: helix-turn-helix domain-containing protein [Anaerolineae bacterium]|nr:helix-turn-helix domain-containing protein [Anaerolineae bacterium]
MIRVEYIRYHPDEPELARHTHDDHQLSLPVRGRITFFFDDGVREIGPESVLLVPPGIPHGVRFPPGGADHLIAFIPPEILDPIYVQVAIQAAVSWRPIPITLPQTPLVRRIGFQLLTEARHPTQLASQLVVESGLTLLVTLALRAQTNPPGTYLLTTDLPPATDRRVQAAIEWLQVHYAEPVSLSELAAAVGISPRHLSRLFREAVGQTPAEYLETLRLSVAQSMLMGTDRSITEIALEVGYTTPSHFSQRFQSRTGLTPSEFRRLV